MTKFTQLKINLLGVLLVLLGQNLGARTAPNSGSRIPEAGASFSQSCSVPEHCLTKHDIGKIVLGVSNNGTFGSNYRSAGATDCFTGEEVPSCEYPKFSNNQYLYGGSFWIGAVVGRDTLVSVGHDGWVSTQEFNPPCEDNFGQMQRKSIIDPSNDIEYAGAISEQDYIAVYTDTNIIAAGTDPDDNNRRHVPLNIEVSQNSYSWSYPYADDFILFDYRIKNIGELPLEQVYMGVYVDADVHWEGSTQGFDDDVCGFVETFVNSFAGCDYLDTVNLAWIADNDGDLNSENTCPNVTATRIVRTPSTNLDVSFNWWVPTPDFGPRERPNKGRLEEEFRDYGTGGLGTPANDRNKYYVLRNKEFDYDQALSGVISQSDTLWLPPNPQEGPGIADGFDTRYLLSFGPFDINPGEQLPVSFAYVGGEDFHQIQGNHLNLPDDPGTYYSNLNFSGLAENGRWASWIYDNPGVDTDGDGYLGRFITCARESIDTDSGFIYTNVDTIYVTGDGVPDFKGASPPPSPDFWITPEVGKLTVRFNGLRSETTRDNFSRLFDFEGYRVYIARDERPSSYTMVASYDREDYNKWVYDPGTRSYVLLDPPFTLDSLRCLYGASCSDSTFDPLDYTRVFPYTFQVDTTESTIYFERQDYNVDNPGVSTPIRKLYPNQPYPSSLNPDSAQASELTEDGYFKFFEYEVVIDSLLPTVPYHINITTFDYGSPASGLPSLESSVTNGSKMAYASSTSGDVEGNNLPVYIYPNPYRIDADYKGAGFEGRAQTDKAADRIRALNFANLPAKCTIRIYSLDGDLIKEIKHDKDASDPTSGHASWDLITRNTQLVVSGLYYWTVEGEDGKTQVGKLMVIM